MGDGSKAVREGDVRGGGIDTFKVAAEKCDIYTSGGGLNCSQFTGETGIYSVVSY